MFKNIENVDLWRFYVLNTQTVFDLQKFMFFFPFRYYCSVIRQQNQLQQQLVLESD